MNFRNNANRRRFTQRHADKNQKNKDCGRNGDLTSRERWSCANEMPNQRLSALICGERLLNHPHVGPVILELVSAVQADNVVFAGRSGDVPV